MNRQKKSAKAEFQHISSQKGHVKKEEHFISHGMRKINDGYGKPPVTVEGPLPTTPLKDACIFLFSPYIILYTCL
jgi:hypothetical protein